MDGWSQSSSLLGQKPSAPHHRAQQVLAEPPTWNSVGGTPSSPERCTSTSRPRQGCIAPLYVPGEGQARSSSAHQQIPPAASNYEEYGHLGLHPQVVGLNLPVKAKPWQVWADSSGKRALRCSKFLQLQTKHRAVVSSRDRAAGMLSHNSCTDCLLPAWCQSLSASISQFLLLQTKVKWVQLV